MSDQWGPRISHGELRVRICISTVPTNLRVVRGFRWHDQEERDRSGGVWGEIWGCGRPVRRPSSAGSYRTPFSPLNGAPLTASLHFSLSCFDTYFLRNAWPGFPLPSKEPDRWGPSRWLFLGPPRNAQPLGKTECAQHEKRFLSKRGRCGLREIQLLDSYFVFCFFFKSPEGFQFPLRSRN